MNQQLGLIVAGGGREHATKLKRLTVHEEQADDVENDTKVETRANVIA